MNILRQFRKAKAMNQPEAADFFGVSTAQISLIECGHRPLPIVVAKKMATDPELGHEYTLNRIYLETDDDSAVTSKHILRQFREAKGMTQCQLAKHFSISQTKISLHESGARPLTVCIAKKMATDPELGHEFTLNRIILDTDDDSAVA